MYKRQPQDLIYLAALLVISALALFLFTAVAGRLWCGYACPQTVYTELFLWVERRLEGDRQARIRLDAAPWGLEKLARKGAKQAVWLAIGLVTGVTFVGYFTPIRSLAADAVALALTPRGRGWGLFYPALLQPRPAPPAGSDGDTAEEAVVVAWCQVKPPPRRQSASVLCTTRSPSPRPGRCM